MRRGGALYQAHSGSGHRAYARHSRKGWRSLHQMDPRDPRARDQGRCIADAAVHEMAGYFVGHIEQRKKHRTDDLISTLMDARDKNGEPLSDNHVLGSLRLLLI